MPKVDTCDKNAHLRSAHFLCTLLDARYTQKDVLRPGARGEKEDGSCCSVASLQQCKNGHGQRLEDYTLHNGSLCVTDGHRVDVISHIA